MFIARTGYTGEDGFEIMLPAKAAPFFWNTLAEKGVKPIGLGARDTLRLEAGMNLYGQDMDETVGPLESGLGWTVDLKSERDFIGKAALLANPPSKKLVGLVLLDRGVLRGHQKVKSASRRRRDHQRLFFAHAGEIHRTGARAERRANRRYCASRDPRQIIERKSSEVSVRPQRQRPD